MQSELPNQPMKNRGKSVKSEQENSNSLYLFPDSNYFSSSSDLRCKKHPSSSSSVGICAYCVSEKLIKLICSDSREQRLSSCSCSGSGLSSYRNSSCTVDVGSIGRISFLIENETGGSGNDKQTMFSHLKMKQSETEDLCQFKRSNSCVVEVKKNNGFWRIRKLFKKRKDKEGSSERNRIELDQKSEVSVMDVSRSRSLSSFMGDKFHHESSAKILAFSESEQGKGGLMDLESGFPTKEADFSRLDDDDEFIDLMIDLSDKSKTECSVFKKYDQLDLIGGGGDGGSSGGSSSCQIKVDDRGIKKVKNSYMKAWKLSFKDHSENNDHNHILKS